MKRLCGYSKSFRWYATTWSMNWSCSSSLVRDPLTSWMGTTPLSAWSLIIITSKLYEKTVGTYRPSAMNPIAGLGRPHPGIVSGRSGVYVNWRNFTGGGRGATSSEPSHFRQFPPVIRQVEMAVQVSQDTSETKEISLASYSGTYYRLPSYGVLFSTSGTNSSWEIDVSAAGRGHARVFTLMYIPRGNRCFELWSQLMTKGGLRELWSEETSKERVP